MKKVSLEKIVEWAGGRSSSGGSCSIRNICTDTRDIRRGDLFLALRGNNFDGHSYVEEAAQKGAVGAVVSSGKYPGLPKSFPLIRVRDSVRAFQKIAAGYRREFSVPVVGITGSNGKTTTKEFVGVLAGDGDKVAMTKGTENNHIGVPLTLLKLDRKT